MSAEYTGHGEHAGLQRHSVGEDYPFTIVGTSSGTGRTRYAWFNCQTGKQGEWKRTHKEAEIDLYATRVCSLMYSDKGK